MELLLENKSFSIKSRYHINKEKIPNHFKLSGYSAILILFLFDLPLPAIAIEL